MDKKRFWELVKHLLFSKLFIIILIILDGAVGKIHDATDCFFKNRCHSAIIQTVHRPPEKKPTKTPQRKCKTRKRFKKR
jgi:hypothetical protein